MRLVKAMLFAYLAGSAYSQIDSNRTRSEIEFGCNSIEYGYATPNNTLIPTAAETIYEFDEPALAYKVLEKLDVFKPVPESSFRNNYVIGNKYDIDFFGVKKNEDYCKIHRSYFVENPEFIFDKPNLLSDHHILSFLKNKAFPSVAVDICPDLRSQRHLSSEDENATTLIPDLSLFFTDGDMYRYFHVGKHFSCLTQASNHIPGHWSIVRKDYVTESAIKYAKQYEDRPQCFSSDRFLPKTWLLNDKEGCEAFFAEFNSPEYQVLKAKHRIVYIRKVAVWSHRGDGVQPVNNQEEEELRAIYQDGKLCGKVNDEVLVQRYVPNPLLIHGRKFDFRMFMFIASTNPLIAYYCDGGLRVSLMPYNIESDDKRTLLTNFALNHNIYKTAREEGIFQGKTEDELRWDQQWTFEKLEKYLLDSGKVSDPNWLENYLRPEFKKAYIHLIRLGRFSFLNTSSSVYEFYGTDFMPDDDMNLWFVEANSGPGFGGYTEETEQIVLKTLKDHFEIVMGLLRSRTKRIINFANTLIRDGQVQETEDGAIEIKDLSERVREFEKITRNYFEKEFEPSANNGFVKIIDENLEGADAYFGYLKPECL